MNIAYISNVVYPFVKGGAERRIHEIGQRLSERGHEVTVYGRHFWDGPSEQTHCGMNLRAVADERELYVDGRRSIREAIAFATALWRPLRQHTSEHDLLVCSVFPYFPVLTAAGVSQERGVPLVTTWHECWREYWWKYLGRLGAGGIATERLVAKLPQYPVAVSSMTADRLSEIGPDRERVTVVPNGINYQQFRDQTPVVDGFDLLTVGRLTEAKRVETVLRAVARLSRSCSVGVVGDGPERQRLEDLASSLGIGSQVSFLGVVDDADVRAHLRGADTFASASTREGFGITLVEAMAADCTVVAVDHPRSAAASVVDGAGFLVGPSVSSLAQGLDRALDGERPATEPVERARSFDWERVTDQAEAVYSAAVNGQQ
jgi:glycosyltransferase involved in cell wall biosynthesis